MLIFMQMLQDGSNKVPIDIWKSENGKNFYGCSKRSRKFPRMLILFYFWKLWYSLNKSWTGLRFKEQISIITGMVTYLKYVLSDIMCLFFNMLTDAKIVALDVYLIYLLCKVLGFCFGNSKLCASLKVCD